MGRSAVGIAADSAGSRANERKGSASSGRGRLGLGRRFRPTRNHAVAAVLIVVGLWAVFSFGRTITQLNSATDRERQLADETAVLAAQLEASQRELVLVQTDGFQALQARAYGIGAPNEIVFALEPGAPSPPPVTPLGSERSQAVPQTPLDAWLRLLFD